MQKDQWQTQKKKNFIGYPQNNQRNHQNNQQNQVYKPVPHQNQTSKQQKGIDSMIPTPQPHGSVAVPTPSVDPKVYQDNQSKDANNKQGIDSMLPTPQPHGSVAVLIPSVAHKVFHNKQSKDANNKQGIDSMLHQPHPINNCVVLSGSEKFGSGKGGNLLITLVVKKFHISMFLHAS
ncbi:hypothetical protein KY289_001157 [Solanum tuberosum]|nr:hypothetical protein KY289_001157 [Solanum tuberosum]